jgi:outer membrane lipoprotein-sorting protein
MKTIIALFLSIQLPLLLTAQVSDLKALKIIEEIDKNMFSKTQIVTSEMIVYGKRKKRIIRSRGYSMGKENNFTEYLFPEREKGTKMLKLNERLWIYSPTTDRTIQLSGHLLRQSVMGSDLSYEDMMEEKRLSEVYVAKIIQEENYNESPVWVMELVSKVEGLAYHKRVLWVDKNKFVPLKENLYAKSGTLLKTTTFSDIRKINKRWFPMKMNYKDVLKDGKGTDFIILDVSFNSKIPEGYFSKNILKK